MEIDRVDIKIAKLTSKILKIDKNLLREFPIEAYAQDFKLKPKLNNYRYVSPYLQNTFKAIRSKYSQNTLVLYHKLALSALIQDSIKKIKKKELPNSIRTLYKEWFERVLDDFSRDSDEIYNHKNDLFLKDLGICSLKLFPVGPFLVEVYRVPKKLFITGGISQFVESLLFVIAKMHRFAPFYEQHTNMRRLNEFNPTGRIQSYIRIAKMLELNHDIRGVIGGSWFNDPNVATISPRLGYLTKIPIENGARVFRIGSSQADIENATTRSKTRRKLYEQGKYLPTKYLLIWTRKDLINWAHKQ